jgi:hypothetical protein
VLGAVAVIIVVGFALSASFREKATVGGVSRALAVFQRQLSIQAAAKEREQGGSGWPDTIELAWFGEDAPRNPLLSPDRPWVEVATPDQADLSDPPVRVAVSTAYAAFWYNPAKGIVRARVPLKMSEAASVELYNQINGTDIVEGYAPFVPALPKADPSPEPTPTDKPQDKPADKKDAKGSILAAPGSPGSDLAGPPRLTDVPTDR